MNYIEITQKEHNNIVKRIEWIQEKERNKQKEYIELQCEAYDRSLIPWTQKIVQILRGTYRPMEIPDNIDSIRQDYICAEPRFANDILEDVKESHGKSIWISTDSYKEIMNNSRDGEKYEWSYVNYRYDILMKPIGGLS